MSYNLENIRIENQSDTIRQKPSGVLQNFKLSWSHHYASEYSLNLTDKKLLQRKLNERLIEFKNIEAN